MRTAVDGVNEGFTFHEGLDELYRNTLELERNEIWGASAVARLYIVGPGGYEQKLELSTGWQARRWTNPETDVEGWRLEITEQPDLSAEDMARIAAVDLIGHGLSARCKVRQVDKPITAGHVWQMKLIPTGEAIA